MPCRVPNFISKGVTCLSWKKKEFYHADLIGLRVNDTDDKFIGTITALYNFGAGDLLEIASEKGSTLMLPFTKACVPKINTSKGFVVVDPMQIEAAA